MSAEDRGLGLRPRPPIDPAVLAAIAIAVEKAWPRRGPTPPVGGGGDQWRFSGRWWNERTALRRQRPSPSF